jgi:hypothetical protein
MENTLTVYLNGEYLPQAVTKKLMQAFHAYAQKNGIPVYAEEYYAEQ